MTQLEATRIKNSIYLPEKMSCSWIKPMKPDKQGLIVLISFCLTRISLEFDLNGESAPYPRVLSVVTAGDLDQL